MKTENPIAYHQKRNTLDAVEMIFVKYRCLSFKEATTIFYNRAIKKALKTGFSSDSFPKFYTSLRKFKSQHTSQKFTQQKKYPFENHVVS